MQTRHLLDVDNDLQDVERVVDFLVARCREAGFDETRLRLNFRVGVTEALVNAILYGNDRDPDKRVRVEARLSARRATVKVTDEGRGFDPQALPDPTLPGNRLRPGGRGIFLIRQLMDEVEFNEQGNSITMVLHSAPIDMREAQG